MDDCTLFLCLLFVSVLSVEGEFSGFVCFRSYKIPVDVCNPAHLP